MKRLSILVLIAVPLMFISCDSLKGPQGPEGPPGVANISTVTFTVAHNDYSIDGSLATYTKTIPEITSDVVNGGTVMAFYGDGSGSWYALPFSWGIDYTQNLEVDETIEVTYGIDYHQFGLILMTSDSEMIVYDGIPTQFKVVIIPPSASVEQISGMKINTYAQFRAALTLE